MQDKLGTKCGTAGRPCHCMKRLQPGPVASEHTAVGACMSLNTYREFPMK